MKVCIEHCWSGHNYIVTKLQFRQRKSTIFAIFFSSFVCRTEHISGNILEFIILISVLDKYIAASQLFHLLFMLFEMVSAQCSLSLSLMEWINKFLIESVIKIVFFFHIDKMIQFVSSLALRESWHGYSLISADSALMSRNSRLYTCIAFLAALYFPEIYTIIISTNSHDLFANSKFEPMAHWTRYRHSMRQIMQLVRRTQKQKKNKKLT